MPTSSRARSSRRKTERATRARRASVATATQAPSRRRASSSHAPRQRYAEDAPGIDALIDLDEPCIGDELVHLDLRAPPHDPRSAAAVARQCARNQLELRVPRLVGVDQ